MKSELQLSNSLITSSRSELAAVSSPPSFNGSPSMVLSAPAASRVFGCVIGVQRGRNVEIFNSFELLYDPNIRSLDRSFLEKKQELYKKVFPYFYILGWYSTGADAEESDMNVHKVDRELNGDLIAKVSDKLWMRNTINI